MRPALLLVAMLAACGSDSSDDPPGGDAGTDALTPPDASEGPRVVGDGLRCPTGLAAFGDHLYWREHQRDGDVVTTRIRRSPLASFAPETLYEGEDRVSRQVATATHLYFTVAQDSASGRLLRVPLTGGTPEPVTDLRQPIAVGGGRVISFEFTDAIRLVDVTEPGPPVALTPIGIGTDMIAGDATRVAYVDAASGRYETFVVTVPGGSRRSVGTNPGRPSLLALSAAGAYWATVPTAPQPSTISDGGPAVATVPGELTDLVAGADAVYAVVRADATTTHPVRVRFSAGAPPSVDTLRGAPQPRSGIAAAAGHAYWFEDHDVTCAPVARLMISE